MKDHVLRAGKAILFVAAFPLVLTGVLMWTLALFGKAAIEAVGKKHPRQAQLTNVR